jgi:gamma-glutamyl:cysteine ligase YbdK (ATP-grasp superfamily)
MTQPARLHLFQGFGIELEYMIVDKSTLAIQPIADELLKQELGTYGSEFENGLVTWSNEIVLHVMELKSTKPELNLNAIENAFADEIKRINVLLEKWNAMLLPTSAHPFMNPLLETRLWSHDTSNVYELYNAIFDCKSHGWSNTQSTHLNLPFYDDEEFAKLHAAARLILPILPALCASSPIIEGKVTGVVDTRLNYYKTHQNRIPSISGKIIPEAIFSKRNYLNTIYDKIKTDLAPFDPENILNPIWVNSRGGVPRFDRGSIEIRIMDIQECPAADMAIIELVIEAIKAFVYEKFTPIEEQIKEHTEMLAGILDDVIAEGQQAMIYSSQYLAAFGITEFCSAKDVWGTILDKLLAEGHLALEKWKPELDIILNEGTLSDRILRELNGDFSQEAIVMVYKKLAWCLGQNRMFVPN